MSEKKPEQPLPLPDAERAGENTEPASGGLRRLLMLGPRGWKRWWIALVRSIEHQEILGQAAQDAAYTFNYGFMVMIGAGIATTGLLLNSPAVIIGAMLISPLMGPIVATGFAIANFDVPMGKRGASTLLLGALVAIGFAATIVWLSPVRELTPEILARARPNLFDLVVAILSGAAGGYGMIRGRGGAIVGVAIATALMPPLAVVGYGLATWQWHVARGALLLFITNMAAIAIAVAAVAEWYGFGRGSLRKRVARHALLSLLVLAPLAVPLFISLKSIAWESRVHATVRSVLEASAMRLKQGQLAQVNVRFGSDELPFVEAIVVSEQPQPGLNKQIQDELRHALGVPVDLRLTQLQADDSQRLDVLLNKDAFKPAATRGDADITAALRTELPFPLAAVEADPVRKSVVIVPRPRGDVGLAGWHDIESALAHRYSGWHIDIVPPTTGFPAVEFAPGVAVLDAAAEKRLQTIAWTLERWGIAEVRLIGHASSTAGGTRALAQRRVATVGKWFADHGIVSQQLGLYPVPKQTTREREVGEAAFRSVEVAPAILAPGPLSEGMPPTPFQAAQGVIP